MLPLHQAVEMESARGQGFNWAKCRRVIIYITLIAIALAQLFPLLWLLDFSLLKSGDLYGAYFMKWPSPPQWINYAKAWTGGMIPRLFLNSLIVVGTACFAAVAFSFMIAYACTRMEWKLRSVVLGLVMLGMMIPIHATLLPNFQLFSRTGILDTYFALIIPYAAFQLPFNTLIFSGFLKTIPRALEESALMDGCSIWGAMFRIVGPITKPAVITVTVMTFIGSWNEVVMMYIFISNDLLRTLPYSVLKFVGYYGADYATQFACMALVALPILLIYAFLNKYITDGATMGAIKG